MSNALKYPSFEARLDKKKDKTYIFDIVRKKWLVLSPEEWVRQHVINYLINVIGFPISRIAVEKELKLNALKKRFDIVVFDKTLKALLIIECKAPYVPLNLETIEQVKRYNLILKAELIMISNGIVDFVFDTENKKVNLEAYFKRKSPEL